MAASRFLANERAGTANSHIRKASQQTVFFRIRRMPVPRYTKAIASKMIYHCSPSCPFRAAPDTATAGLKGGVRGRPNKRRGSQEDIGPHTTRRSMSYGLILISSTNEALLGLALLDIHAHVSISKESVGLPVKSSFMDVLRSLI